MQLFFFIICYNADILFLLLYNIYKALFPLCCGSSLSLIKHFCYVANSGAVEEW